MLTEAPGGEVCCAWCPGQHPWPGPRPLSPTAHRTMFPPPRSTHPEKASARPAGTRRQEVSPGPPPPPSPHGFRLGAPQTHGFLAELAKKGKGRLTQLLRVVRCRRGFHKVIVWREKKNKTKQKWNCHHSVPIDEASVSAQVAKKSGIPLPGIRIPEPGATQGSGRPIPGGEEMAQETPGAIRSGPGVSSRGQVRANFPRVRPAAPRARRAPRPHPRPSARGAHLGVRRASRRRPGAERPQSFPCAPGGWRACGVGGDCGSSRRPPGPPPRAHPRRPLLGDRGGHAGQRRARFLPTLCWRGPLPPP